jgi:hypothetical protein
MQPGLAKPVFVDPVTGEIFEQGKVYVREVDMHPEPVAEALAETVITEGRVIPANTAEMDGQVKPEFKAPKAPGFPKDYVALYNGWDAVFSKEDIKDVVEACNQNAQTAHLRLLTQYKRKA